MSTLPSYVQALDQPVLRHGDTIALTCPSGYLQAEGHLDLRLWVRDAAPPLSAARYHNVVMRSGGVGGTLPT